METRASASLIARFWSKVDTTARPSGCWPWLASRNADGYGRFHDHLNRQIRAHRWAYAYLIGPIPEGMCVCHRCDNPSCVNPAHLFLGTPADNAADRNTKERQARGAATRPETRARGDANGARRHPERMFRGERVNLAKLTADQVREIRARHSAGGVTQQTLADDYGVTQPTIGKVLLRQTWAHVD